MHYFQNSKTSSKFELQIRIFSKKTKKNLQKMRKKNLLTFDIWPYFWYLAKLKLRYLRYTCCSRTILVMIWMKTFFPWRFYSDFDLQGDSNVRFFERVSVTQPQLDQLTWNFACGYILGGHMTSTEAKPVLASKCDWPL